MMRILAILVETIAVIVKSILLPLAKLLIVLLALAETVGWVVLGLWSVNRYQQNHHEIVFLWPLLATVAIYLQVSLWYYFWLKIAQSGDVGRAMGEYFCSGVRHPVARPPHPWE